MSKFNVQRYKSTLVLAHLTNATTIDSPALPLNGLLLGIVVVAPVLGSTNTYTINIKDVDGNTLFTKSGIAQNATAIVMVDANNLPLQIPVATGTYIDIVTNASQTADRTFTFSLLVLR